MEQQVSHNDIYRELGELKGLMSSIVLRGQKDDDEKKDIFKRLNTLETRMAQVLLLAVMASLFLPPILNFVGQHFHLNVRPTAASVSK